MTLMLHCGGEQVTRQMVEAVPVPEKTDTWYPVPYGDTIAFLHDQAKKRLNREVVQEAYGLNKEGKQMFALLTLEARDDSGLALGLRASYDKSLARGMACGSHVFVCDNLAFSGDAFVVVRKHTKNCARDFREMVIRQLMAAADHEARMARDIARMKATPCHEQRGYSILGVAQGQGILTPTQATVAFGDWRKPRYEDFAPRNLWSLYNCVTEGLKKGSPGTIIDRHAAAHDFFTERLAA